MAGTVVRIDPQELRDAASNIDTQRGVVVDAVTAIKSKVDEISAGMEGQASTAFLDGFNEMYPTLHDQFPEVMEGICKQLQTIAQVMEEADQQLQAALRG